MFNWRILVICTLLIVICAAQDMEILSRPIRPEKFTSHEELQDYLQKLKAYHLQNGHRYGKRFSSPMGGGGGGRLHPQFLPENWRDIYEIVKHYDEQQNNGDGGN